jgi:polar amino acid transport system substrate-binding protein
MTLASTFRIFLLLFCLTSQAYSSDVGRRPVTVCVEDRFWPLGSFFVDGRPAGTQISLLQRAFEENALVYKIIPMPWKRCLSATANGDIDAVLGAAYRPSRAEKYRYPDGATNVAPHTQAIGQTSFVLVLNKGKKVSDLSKGLLPYSPVAMPIGYPTAETLRKQGVTVVEVVKSSDLFDLLSRRRVGGLLLIGSFADFFRTRPTVGDKFEYHPMPQSPTPSYLAFSRKSTLPVPVIQTIWRSVATARADNSFVAAAQEKARSEVALCLADPDKCE